MTDLVVQLPFGAIAILILLSIFLMAEGLKAIAEPKADLAHQAQGVAILIVGFAIPVAMIFLDQF
ncbi:MAG: hypothetical protein AAB675_01200 [Patescibacteria group bacterium]